MTALLDAPDYGLSPREKDVARLLLGGLPTKNIARLLGVQPDTVKFHLRGILLKTHTGNRTAAALRLAGSNF